MKKRQLIKSPWLSHLGLWLSIWVSFIYLLGYKSTNTDYVLILASVLTPVAALTAYLFTRVLIPRFLLSKRYDRFLIYSLASVLLTTFVTVTLIILLIALLPGLKATDLPDSSSNYIYTITWIYLLVAIISFRSIWVKQQQATKQNAQLEQQVLETRLQLKEQQLAYLKSQIHPHFLFNTLNTIYGAALKQSADTPEMVLKLSSLLDYTLYQSQKERVLLSSEVEHIKQYIDLERIRFRDALDVSFDYDIEHKTKEIAPMLFLPLVENAFKHGTKINEVLSIQMELKQTVEELHFHIKNASKPASTQPGIGLENLRKRLALHYPDCHSLEIKPTEDSFEVDLKVFCSQKPI